MTEPITKKLLVIDDVREICDFVCEVAEDLDYEVTSFTESVAFVDNYSGDFDVMVLDLTMPDMDGIELISFLAERNCRSTLILISGFDEGLLAIAERLAQERGLNVAGAIHKPIDIDILEGLLGKAKVREAG